MSRAFGKLIKRAKELGIQFRFEPTRAHNRLQGQQWDTFACTEDIQGRLYPSLEMTYKNRQYIELCFWDSISTLAKAPVLEIQQDDTFPYRLYIKEPAPVQPVEYHEQYFEGDDDDEEF